MRRPPDIVIAIALILLGIIVGNFVLNRFFRIVILNSRTVCYVTGFLIGFFISKFIGRFTRR